MSLRRLLCSRSRRLLRRRRWMGRRVGWMRFMFLVRRMLRRLCIS